MMYERSSKRVPQKIIIRVIARTLSQQLGTIAFGVAADQCSMLSADTIGWSVTLQSISGPACTLGCVSCSDFIIIFKRHSLSQHPLIIHIAVALILSMVFMPIPLGHTEGCLNVAAKQSVFASAAVACSCVVTLSQGAPDALLMQLINVSACLSERKVFALCELLNASLSSSPTPFRLRNASRNSSPPSFSCPLYMPRCRPGVTLPALCHARSLLEYRLRGAEHDALLRHRCQKIAPRLSRPGRGYQHRSHLLLYQPLQSLG